MEKQLICGDLYCVGGSLGLFNYSTHPPPIFLIIYSTHPPKFNLLINSTPLPPARKRISLMKEKRLIPLSNFFL